MVPVFIVLVRGDDVVGISGGQSSEEPARLLIDFGDLIEHRILNDRLVHFRILVVGLLRERQVRVVRRRLELVGGEGEEDERG